MMIYGAHGSSKSLIRSPRSEIPPKHLDLFWIGIEESGDEIVSAKNIHTDSGLESPNHRTNTQTMCEDLDFLDIPIATTLCLIFGDSTLSRSIQRRSKVKYRREQFSP